MGVKGVEEFEPTGGLYDYAPKNRDDRQLAWFRFLLRTASERRVCRPRLGSRSGATRYLQP